AVALHAGVNRPVQTHVLRSRKDEQVLLHRDRNPVLLRVALAPTGFAQVARAALGIGFTLLLSRSPLVDDAAVRAARAGRPVPIHLARLARGSLAELAAGKFRRAFARGSRRALRGGTAPG